MRKGLAVSPGIVVGRALVVDCALRDGLESTRLGTGQTTAELERLQRAIASTASDLAALVTKVETQVGVRAADIFRSHQLILADESLTKKVKDQIVQHGLTATSALNVAFQDYKTIFEQIEDEYLRHRLADVRDVIARIQSQLVVSANNGFDVGMDPLVVVAREILPSQAVSLGDINVAGIVTETGSNTSHAAILARSRAIPAVSGLIGITAELRSGDTVIVDGRNGDVIVNPGPEVLTVYRTMQRDFAQLRDRLIERRDLPTVTPDGVDVELMANIHDLAGARLAVDFGAVGVGLYRTEYFFLTHPSIPDEDEQVETYSQVIEAAPTRRVTIRTLDLGGDKVIPFLGHRGEANPFLGWRSLRISFEHPELFQTQIRGILRSACCGRVRLLFPMVTTPDEIQRVRRFVRRSQAELRRRGVPFSEDIEIGAMIEVPAAAICIDKLLESVDFVSIGSNDLVQYITAADRDNPKVAHLCDPLSLAVLRVITIVVDACSVANKPVAVCGEMAGQPRACLALLGLGVRQSSMSPALIPTIKELVRSTPVAEAQKCAQYALTLTTSRQIRGHLTRHLHRLCPKLEMLDTTQ